MKKVILFIILFFLTALADIVIPQEYGMTKEEKLIIGLGICGQLLKKIRGDLLRDYNDEESENVNRLNPHYSQGNF